jgi:ribosomal protein S18 acetylase RimI-like enzyme
MSKSVARKLTALPLHTRNYGEEMIVRRLESRDIDQVVARVKERLASDAARNGLLNAGFSHEHFASALRDAASQTWVAEESGVVVGHLFGALLDSLEYGRGAWVGPDGVSFQSPAVLDALYAEAGAEWIERQAIEHYAWVFDEPNDTNPWYELGFARMHVRGVYALAARETSELPAGYQLRRGGPHDLELALELDRVLDDAQQRGPSFALFVEHASRPDEMLEMLEDPDVRYYVVEYEGRGVAQCLTFGLEARRGSFDDALHLSALSVRPEHEHRGVARALVDHALREGIDDGFRFVETNWRVTNHRAAGFWLRYGFRPTYVRLHRTIGSG